MDPKLPRSSMTPEAYVKEPLSVKGAIYQHVWERSEEWENPRNCKDEMTALYLQEHVTHRESAASNIDHPLQYLLESFMVDVFTRGLTVKPKGFSVLV